MNRICAKVTVPLLALCGAACEDTDESTRAGARLGGCSWKGVTDATRLPDGGIVIANAGSSELRVFNPDGSHSATWGRRGEGPGEFTTGSPAAVARWPGDSIAAPNRWGGRLSIFDKDGNHGRDVHLEAGLANVVDLLPNGGIVTGGIAGMHGGMTGSTGLVRPRGRDARQNHPP